MSEADPHNVRLIAEFEFTPAEVREAIHAITGKRCVPGRLWWILIGVLAIFLFLLFREIAAESHRPLAEFVSPMLPWLIILGFVLFLVFWLHRRAQKKSRLQKDTWKVVADDSGLVLGQPYERTELAWEAFIHFSQTHNLFLLFKRKLMAVVIPKRAFANPSEADAFQRLAESRISPRISAFPVLPAKQPEIQPEPPA